MEEKDISGGKWGGRDTKRTQTLPHPLAWLPRMYSFINLILYKGKY